MPSRSFQIQLTSRYAWGHKQEVTIYICIYISTLCHTHKPIHIRIHTYDRACMPTRSIQKLKSRNQLDAFRCHREIRHRSVNPCTTMHWFHTNHIEVRAWCVRVGHQYSSRVFSASRSVYLFFLMAATEKRRFNHPVFLVSKCVCVCVPMHICGVCTVCARRLGHFDSFDIVLSLVFESMHSANDQTDTYSPCASLCICTKQHIF